MKQLVGKVCPYCKGVFSEDDDVVVCSECEMPHHKACWMENQGCTTFGCTGTIESPEQLCSVNRLPDADDDFEIDIFHLIVILVQHIVLHAEALMIQRIFFASTVVVASLLKARRANWQVHIVKRQLLIM